MDEKKGLFYSSFLLLVINGHEQLEFVFKDGWEQEKNYIFDAQESSFIFRINFIKKKYNISRI